MINFKNSEDKVLSSYLEDRNLLYKHLLKRPKSLSKLLPYDEYLADSKVFILKDGSLGAVYRVNLVPHEVLTEKQVLRVTNSINSWFKFSDEFVVQVSYESNFVSPNDQVISDIKLEEDKGHKVSSMLFKKKVEKLQESCVSRESGGLLKRSLFVSIRYFPKGTVKPEQAGEHTELISEKKNFKSHLRTFLHSLANMTDSNDLFTMEKLDIDQLAGELRRFFNPVSFYERSFSPVNTSSPLSDQIIFCFPKVYYDRIEREGIVSKVLSVKAPPSSTFPGGMAQFVELPFPFRINLNVSFPSASKVKKFLAAKGFFLENALSAKARIQREEIKKIEEDLARDDRGLQVTFTVIVDGSNEEELDERSRKISQILSNELECSVIEESHIGTGLCLNSLPLNYTPAADLSTHRSMSILRSEISNLVPIFDTTSSLGNPTAIYTSREGGLVPFSLLGEGTSNHTVVIGDTGSAKSSFVNDTIVAMKRLSPEPIVFVIDKKSSYGMVSRYYDADMTVFDRDEEIPFSPFRGRYNEEKVAFLTKLTLMAVRLVSPGFPIESEHQTAITEAIKRAYVKKESSNGLKFIDGELVQEEAKSEIAIGMADVVAELGALTGDESPRIKEMIKDLAVKLRPFYGDGIYARFFTEGKGNITDSSKLFFVYDLDALDGDPILQSLMTMAVTEEIRSILSLPENQGRTGFLILEEFAMLGRNNPAFRDFAIDFAETMRKRGCWLITLTPRPENYFNLEVGRAFWGVAENYVFLAMNPDNVDFAAKNSALFDEANTQIIKSLRTVPGKHAEIFFMNKSKTKQGTFRFKQTEYDRWMCPSNAKDSLKVLQAFEKYPNKWEALRYLVNNSSDKENNDV